MSSLEEKKVNLDEEAENKDEIDEKKEKENKDELLRQELIKR